MVNRCRLIFENARAFEENTKEGLERVDKAIKTYAKFAKEAPELKLQQFFSALVEIETDHLELHAENLEEWA